VAPEVERERVLPVVAALAAEGIRVSRKVGDHEGVDAVDLIQSGEVDLIVNTPRGRGPRADGDHIRMAATRSKVPCLTTVAAALAAAAGIAEMTSRDPAVHSLQEYHLDAQLRFGV